jgi:hypothetical protein
LQNKHTVLLSLFTLVKSDQNGYYLVKNGLFKIRDPKWRNVTTVSTVFEIIKCRTGNSAGKYIIHVSHIIWMAPCRNSVFSEIHHVKTIFRAKPFVSKSNPYLERRPFNKHISVSAKMPSLKKCKRILRNFNVFTTVFET